MRIIYKYEVSPELSLPIGAQIVSFQIQGGKYCLWAIVDPDEKEFLIRKFRLYGTGQLIDGFKKYIGAIQEEGIFVWHLFEIL